MRRIAVFTSALLFALITVLAGVGPLDAQSPAPIKPPPDFSFEKQKDSPGTVTFSHEQHKTKVDKCTACHVKVFKMKKGTTGPLTMEKMKAGEQCGTCHNGKTEIAGVTPASVADDKSCEKCHKK